MSRRKNISPSRPLTLKLPESTFRRLEELLWSEAEDCVPLGAYKTFFTNRVEEFLSWQRLDLGKFEGLPPGYYVFGPEEMVERLKTKLEEKVMK